MLSVASARSVRRATLRSLRELTRLAVTALALAVGLGGATTGPVAPPPATVAQLQPSAVTSQADVLRPEAPPAAERLAESAASTIRPAHGRVVAAPAGAVATTPDAVPVAGPGHGAPGRRGPPFA
ncbi:hypothetical protein [Micromonospora sp. WMMD812]|uniref:hypothetical protein n=1 Tax=Micromonospora sp. WMMD812 TaxID=3015152 RepID=UPI00248B6030|nr:hypothetical protein [Micromonospora sp. WMMD812]WBB65288.1 hypothetical protein O7603_18935 [Micromonospora sp. WMMD812]